MHVKIKKLYDDAIIPTYANPGDAGADLYSQYTATVGAGEWALISTGISIAIPEDYVGFVNPRSGLAARFGISVLNAPGTIDSGYRGEVLVNVINTSRQAYKINKGDRIAQLLIVKCPQVQIVESTDLDDTVRGSKGHGSTGGFTNG